MKKNILQLSVSISMFMMSLFAFTGCASVEQMKKDADRGDENAQVLLALKYFYGSQDVKSVQYDDAALYFGKAARSENPLACYYMGEIYESGLGQTDVDYAKALAYYRRAASSMHELPAVLRRPAYLAMAKMYDYGRGVKKSVSKAKYYYDRAYDSGVLGSSSLIADFLERTKGKLSADDLKHILDDAMDENDPQAKYMYAQAIIKNDPDKAGKLLQQAGDANYPPAIYAEAAAKQNKMLMKNANEKAAAGGYAPAFYELALAESDEDKRYEFLKKSADRGFVNAIQALGDYHENRKEWNSASVYHYMADKINGHTSPASIRLQRISGLGLAVKSIWENKQIPEIASIGTNVEYFIRGYRAGIAKIRENYQKYIADNPEKAYVNMDYVRLFNEKMPMLMAGDIFRIYYESRHGSVGNDFYLNYAIAAGYAGQGAVQFYAAEKINLNYKYQKALEWHLAKLLLKANALALMGSSDDAYELLFANYREKLSSGYRNFIIDFVNGNCNMLLKDINKLSAALNIPADKFVLYKPFAKQEFYDLENRCDSYLVEKPEEPDLKK